MLGSYPAKKNWVQYRDYSILLFLWRTCVRTSECCDVKRNDVNWETGAIRIQCGKGGKYRTIGIDHQSLELIRQWVEFCDRHRFHTYDSDGRHAYWQMKTEYLFPNKHGKRLPRRVLHFAVGRSIRYAGMEDRGIYPHLLRHTGAVHMLDEGITVGDIQRQLGHSSIATTAIYLARLNPKALIERMHRRELNLDLERRVNQ